MEGREKDKLDQLTEEISWAQYVGFGVYPQAFNSKQNAELYEKVAKGLANPSRRKQALEEAAQNYLRSASDFGNSDNLEDLRNALRIYIQIDEREKAERTRAAIVNEQREQSKDLLKLIADKHRCWEVNFRSLQNLPDRLTEAGFHNLAEKYAEIINELVDSAKEDIRTLSR